MAVCGSVHGTEVGVRLFSRGPILPLDSCRALVKLGNLPEPQFLQLETGDNGSSEYYSSLQARTG